MSMHVIFHRPATDEAHGERRVVAKWSHARMSPVFDSSDVYADPDDIAGELTNQAMNWPKFKEQAQRCSIRDADPNYYDFLTAISAIVARPDASEWLVSLE